MEFHGSAHFSWTMANFTELVTAVKLRMVGCKSSIIH